MIIVGSYAGAPNAADPRAHMEVGTNAYDVTMRELPQAETARVVPLFELTRA
jgi:hypothetical protein